MQELIKELVEKVGLSEEAAQKAIDTTMNFVKGKLPPMFSDKLDDIMNGKFDLASMFGGGKSDGAGDSPLDKLKNLF
jgi:hypothetical protein